MATWTEIGAPGLDQALLRLNGAVTRANGRPVFVVGEPGSGKTYLLEQFAKRFSKKYNDAFLINPWMDEDVDVIQRIESVRGIATEVDRKILVVVDDIDRRRNVVDLVQRLQAVRLGHQIDVIVATAILPRVENFRINPMPPVDLGKLANLFGSLDFLQRFFAAKTSVDFVVVADDGHLVVKSAVPDTAIAIIDAAGTIVRAVPHIVIPRIESRRSRAIDELERLINRADVCEQELQNFMQVHPDFLTGLEYEKVFPQVVLERVDEGPLRPDFLLKLIGKQVVDLLDLKLPRAKLISGSKNRQKFSHPVEDGFAQLREYRNYFEDPGRREALLRKLGVMAYRPTATLVIGRTIDGIDPEKAKQITDDLPPYLRLLTYDDLIARMKRLSQMIK